MQLSPRPRSPVATPMLLVRAPPSLPPLSAAANFPANLERHLLRGASSSRAGAAVATAAAAAKPAASSVGGQKRKQVASVANPLVKHCVKLRLSAAYRRSYRRLLLVGLAPILEVCRFELDAIDYLLLLDGVEVPEVLREFAGDVVYASAAVMKKVSGMQSVDSTEAIAVMHMPNHFRDLGSHDDGDALHGLFSYPKRILVLDGIQDPGNLGTLIRSACAFNWDGVFLLPACCDPFNEKAIRSARGASLQLPIVSGTWHDLHSLMTKYGMKMMAGHPESCSDASKEIYSLSKELADSLLNESLCLVLGSEGNGLSAETLQACELVNIPMEGLLMKYEKRETRKGGKSFNMFGFQHKVIWNDPILEPKLTMLFGLRRGTAPSVIKCFQGELIVSEHEVQSHSVKSDGSTHSMSAGSADAR